MGGQTKFGCFPHFEVDLFIDEVKPFSSTDATGISPILGRIHSIFERFQMDSDGNYKLMLQIIYP